MFAAVDLGSNSFHMIVARVVRGELRIVDRIREQVQLAAGLDEHGRIRRKTQARALECLARFRGALRPLAAAHVRAVGTNALRVARDGRAFLERARKALGHRIEVISGSEEARLVYLGVAHSLADGGNRRLVVDIGGGSTECILGAGFEPEVRDSLYMGCVGYSLRHFRGGEIRRAAFKRAELAARSELQPIEKRYRNAGWDTCVGSSGTIVAIGEVLRANGWDRQGITPRALNRLKRVLLDAGHTDRLRLPGLRPDRAPILPGGLAILCATFEALGIERMAVSSGSLREGLLYDLLGRIRHEDVRDRTVARMCERYHVDLEQAARVERTAIHFFGLVAKKWSLDDYARRLLGWAARLHEVGLAVAYSGHHKHGAYLVAHSDLPGFSRDDQEMLATLIRTHRRKVSARLFADLPLLRYELARRLSVLLRLAVLLNRSRSPRPPDSVSLRARDHTVRLDFKRSGLGREALTRADLEGEAAAVEKMGFRLDVE